MGLVISSKEIRGGSVPTHSVSTLFKCSDENLPELEAAWSLAGYNEQDILAYKKYKPFWSEVEKIKEPGAILYAAEVHIEYSDIYAYVRLIHSDGNTLSFCNEDYKTGDPYLSLREGDIVLFYTLEHVAYIIHEEFPFFQNYYDLEFYNNDSKVCFDGYASLATSHRELLDKLELYEPDYIKHIRKNYDNIMCFYSGLFRDRITDDVLTVDGVQYKVTESTRGFIGSVLKYFCPVIMVYEGNKVRVLY